MTWSFWSDTFPTNLLLSKPNVNSPDSIHLHTYLPAAIGPGTCPIFQLYLAGIHCLWANKHNSTHEQDGEAKTAAAPQDLLELVSNFCNCYSRSLRIFFTEFLYFTLILKIAKSDKFGSTRFQSWVSLNIKWADVTSATVVSVVLLIVNLRLTLSFFGKLRLPQFEKIFFNCALN